ncbi:hypothetical protein [Microvirga yunnanensis]|uniref:hypothetical protein n=1 Tax=Microvirga yunnanensis TaxID=2953740 RepID=UPI0021CA8181|nr:hypothetical protein [Microvirga sp. HBU65207]
MKPLLALFVATAVALSTSGTALANEAGWVHRFRQNVRLGSQVIAGASAAGAQHLTQRFVAGSQVLWVATATGAAHVRDYGAIGAEAVWSVMPSRDQVRDAVIAAGVVAVTTGGATYLCTVVGGATLGPLGAAAGGLICATVGQAGGRAAVQYTYDRFDVPLNPTALTVGSFIGGAAGMMAGSVAAADTLRQLTISRYASFSEYAKDARRLSELTARPYAPEFYRQRGFHLDHLVPLKCGWQWGWAAAEMAAVRNLQFLPAGVNLTLGAKGC